MFRGGGLSSSKLGLGFTLAEVLITLGIIGIVAALTLPILVGKYQKNITVERLKQTYNILQQAVVASQAQYGDIINWDVSVGFDKDSENPTMGVEYAKAFADKYFIPHLKLAHPPVLAQLKSLGYPNYKVKSGAIYIGYTVNKYIAELPNGVTLFFDYNGNSSLNTYTLPIIFVDINGKQGPNIVGRDFFLFQFELTSSKKLALIGASSKRDRLRDLCLDKAADGKGFGSIYCGTLIFVDGWQIKDDYPW